MSGALASLPSSFAGLIVDSFIIGVQNLKNQGIYACELADQCASSDICIVVANELSVGHRRLFFGLHHEELSVMQHLDDNP